MGTTVVQKPDSRLLWSFSLTALALMVVSDTDHDHLKVILLLGFAQVALLIRAWKRYIDQSIDYKIYCLTQRDRNIQQTDGKGCQ